MSMCELCGRPFGEKPSSTHHLVPVMKGGRNGDTVELHDICHRKIHSVFSEKELKQYFHTIERLLQDWEIAEFVEWVKKKDPDFHVSSKDSEMKGKHNYPKIKRA
jgi:5-methylcytosine-specific restriction endonuclease McrA